MAKTFISELGDRYGGEGVSNESAHVNVIAPYFYTRNDSGNISHPSIQESIDAAITGVKITEKSDNVEYKLLAAKSTTGSNTEAVYDTNITMNPSTNTLTANLSGTATYAKALDPQMILSTTLYKVPVISADKEVRWTGAPGASGSTVELTYDNADGKNLLAVNISGTAAGLNPAAMSSTVLYKVPLLKGDKTVAWTGAPGASGSTVELSYNNNNGANLLNVNISGNAAAASSLTVGAMANTGSFKLVCFDDNGTGFWETDASKGRLLYDAATNALGVSITGTARTAITADNYSTTGTIKSALDGKQSSLPTTTISGETIFNIKTAGSVYANSSGTAGTADNYSTTGTIKSALDGKQSSLPMTTVSGESVFNIKTAGAIYANTSGTASSLTVGAMANTGSFKLVCFDENGTGFWETDASKGRLLYDAATNALGVSITGNAHTATTADNYSTTGTIKSALDGKQSSLPTTTISGESVFNIKTAGSVYANSSGTAGTATNLSLTGFGSMTTSLRVAAFNDAGAPYWETTTGKNRLLYDPDTGTLGANITGSAYSARHLDMGTVGEDLYKVPVVIQGKTGADASHNGDVYLPSGVGLIYNSVSNQLNVSITGDCSGTATYATYAYAGTATVISCADIPANPESSLTYRLCAIDESGVPRWETTSSLGRLLYAPADNLLNCNIVGHANWASCIGSQSSHPQIGNPGTPVYVTNSGVITACDSVNTFASVSDLTNKDGSHWDTSTTYIERDYIYCPAAPSGGIYTINMLRLRPGKVYKILLANSSGGTTIEFCKNSGTSFTFVSGYTSYTTTRASVTTGTHSSSYAVYVLRTDDNNLFQIWGY